MTLQGADSNGASLLLVCLVCDYLCAVLVTLPHNDNLELIWRSTEWIWYGCCKVISPSPYILITAWPIKVSLSNFSWPLSLNWITKADKSGREHDAEHHWDMVPTNVTIITAGQLTAMSTSYMSVMVHLVPQVPFQRTSPCGGVGILAPSTKGNNLARFHGKTFVLRFPHERKSRGVWPMMKVCVRGLRVWLLPQGQRHSQTVLTGQQYHSWTCTRLSWTVVHCTVQQMPIDHAHDADVCNIQSDSLLLQSSSQHTKRHSLNQFSATVLPHTGYAIKFKK